MHSRTVRTITGTTERKENTGQNCFRFLVPLSKMQDNPLTASLLNKIGLDGVHAFAAEDRRLVVYPCRKGTLLNVAGIHPATSENTIKDSSWLDSGSREQLLQIYQSFGPELQEMCRIAEDVKLWSLGSRVPPRRFIKGKLALVGDSAHPTLPHQGQGGALFTAETTPEQVPQRLEIYNKVRYDRALTVMMMSRVQDERRAEMLDTLRCFVPNAEIPGDMFAFAWCSYPASEVEGLLGAAGVEA